MVFNIGWHMLMMWECACQGFIVGMRKVIVPVKSSLPAINFIAIGCDQACVKIQFFPMTQADTRSKKSLPFRCACIWAI